MKEEFEDREGLLKGQFVVSNNTFCEYCAEDRKTALVRVGRWFVWFCFPCHVRYELKAAWQRITRRLRVEVRGA